VSSSFYMTKIINFVTRKDNPSIIKVIGVGGAGRITVQHLYHEGKLNVTYLLCDTDKYLLMQSDIPEKLLLGKSFSDGISESNDPWVAQEAAKESADDIKMALDDGTKMVFVIAGMGGQTGAGAAPIIAGIAKEMGILTMGIVSIPFVFEGKHKILRALKDVEEMRKNVDSLLVINNERLNDIFYDLDLVEMFAKADEFITNTVKSISEIITETGFIQLDFDDIRNILKDGGTAIVSSGLGEGENRVSKAINNALFSPFLKNNDVFKAKKILLQIAFSDIKPLLIKEIDELNNFFGKFGADIGLSWGTGQNPELEDKVKITILASGFTW